MKKPLLYLLVLLVAVFSTSCTQSSKGTFEVGDKTFLLNGEPFVVKAAEIHYPRIPKEYWELVSKCLSLGQNTICLYVFWNFHEPEEGKYDFTGQKDIAAFCLHGTRKRNVRHCTSRTLRLRRMGNGRTTLVVAEKRRYQTS